jgi:hypothetical protein
MSIFNLKNSTIAILGVIIILGLSYSAIRFALSKENVSFPKKDHAHMRIKYIFNGQEENFGSPRYQTDYTKDICNGSLTESPLHFHDNKTDYQHLHWAKVTGGQFFKFYGINKIGGLDDTMGFKIDKLLEIKKVPIYGKHLPEPRTNDKYWIYTGIEKAGNWDVKTKTLEEFVNQDFETFLGSESQVRKDEEKYGTGYLNLLDGVKAQAHSGVEHKDITEEQKHLLELGEKANTELLNNLAVTSTLSSVLSSVKSTNGDTEAAFTSSQISSRVNSGTPKAEFDPVTGEELKSINNFLGDVVIFVQPDAPTPDQIQARFKSMVKLDKSSCGG